ncbi:MAG: hypothetical protein ACD_40C00279G0001 [uncultured bacterium]|nr:MAG: hypothetical protein ACD_40C00279G0001 [uncultured bacterium]
MRSIRAKTIAIPAIHKTPHPISVPYSFHRSVELITLNLYSSPGITLLLSRTTCPFGTISNIVVAISLASATGLATLLLCKLMASMIV